MLKNFFQLILERHDPKKRKKLPPVVKNILTFFNHVLSVFLYLIFRIFKLKLFSSSIEALGHQILDLESFILENKNYKFKLLISTDRKHISNRHFFLNYQKEKIRCITFENKFLSTILHYQKRYPKLIFDSYKYTADENALSYKILKDKFLKNDFYKVSRSDVEYGRKFLERNNLINKKFILIHARDSFYRPLDHERLRNSNFDDFQKSIDWLLERGVAIIRIGHNDSNRSKFENRIIDLTFEKNEEKKEILSIFLSYNCEFFIGASSGAKTFAAIFGKPILTTNAAPLTHSLEVCTYGISIPKLYKRNKKILSFHEMKNIIKESLLKKNEIFNNYRRDDFYSFRNIEVIDNTEEEILEATKEIYHRTYKNDFTEDDLQRKFRNVLKNTYSGEALGSISSSFIKKYKDLL